MDDAGNFTWVKPLAPIKLPGGLIPVGASFPAFTQCQALVLKNTPQSAFHVLAGLWAHRLVTKSEEFDQWLKPAGFPFPWIDDNAPEPLASQDIGAITISLFEENIANAGCEVIVNAANEGLWMGGGVAGALRSRGGYEIEKEARTHAPATVGDVVLTSPGKLSALQIYHAVVIDQLHMTGTQLSMVEVSFKKIIQTALANRVSSIAVPMLGCGVGGLLTADVAQSYLRICQGFVQPNKNPLLIFLVERDPDNITNTAKIIGAPLIDDKDDPEIIDFLKKYEESLKKGTEE